MQLLEFSVFRTEYKYNPVRVEEEPNLPVIPVEGRYLARLSCWEGLGPRVENPPDMAKAAEDGSNALAGVAEKFCCPLEKSTGSVCTLVVVGVATEGGISPA